MGTEGLVKLRFCKVVKRCDETGLLTVNTAEQAELTRFFDSGLEWS